MGMAIDINAACLLDLLDAIEAAPFTPGFKEALIREILTAPDLRFGGPQSAGLFEVGEIAVGEDRKVAGIIALSAAGEVFQAALQQLGRPGSARKGICDFRTG